MGNRRQGGNLVKYWMCKCGKKVSTNIMVCPYCKSPADQETQRKYNPNLATCRDCKKSVSREATVCPHCGCKDPSVPQDIRMTAYIIAAIISIIVGCVVFVRCQNANEEAIKTLKQSQDAIEDAQRDLKRAEGLIGR